MTARIGLLHTRLRTEERLLLDAAEALGCHIEPIDVRPLVFDPTGMPELRRFDVILDRCVSLTASRAVVGMLESMGLRCINTARAIAACSDKLETTLRLLRDSVPTPDVRIAFDQHSAIDAVEDIGYPAVLKPTVGSWGRLVARANDRDAAEAIIEHRSVLGSAQHGLHYIQQHIDKPHRDLRVFVVGDRAIAAIERRAEHWITNTARGGRTAGLSVSDELASVSLAAARAVEADVCAIDLLECPHRGLLVNEVNHSMEFRNSVDVTGVDIPRLVVEHARTCVAEVAS
ncbi:MAG: lysine biosynthesis protein LysX [Planctomycetota bacterium]